MARPKPWEVDDELWAVVEPLVPKAERRYRTSGTQAASGPAGVPGHPVRAAYLDRIAWEYLPQELGFGSGMTCWRRLAEWIEAGVWPPRLHEVLLAKLVSANVLDFSRAVVDGSRIRALTGEPGPDETLLTGAEPAADTT